MHFKLLLLMVLFCSAYSCAQPNFNDKYKIDLPDEWKKNSRIRYKVSEIAPLAFEEIRDKQFCLNCDAPLVLKLYIDTITITDQRFSEKNRNETYGYKSTSQIYQGRSVNVLSGNRVVTSVTANYQANTTYTVYISLRLMGRDGMLLKDLILSGQDEPHQKNIDFSLSAGSAYDSNAYPFIDLRSYTEKNKENFSPKYRDILNLSEDILFSFIISK